MSGRSRSVPALEASSLTPNSQFPRPGQLPKGPTFNSQLVSCSRSVPKQRRDNSDQLSALIDDRILVGGQQPALSENAQTKPRLFEFPRGDLSLGGRIARTTPIVGLLVVCAGRCAASQQLIRKCGGNWTTSVEKLHHADDE